MVVIDIRMYQFEFRSLLWEFQEFIFSLAYLMRINVMISLKLTCNSKIRLTNVTLVCTFNADL
jgi:hypothetical protein